MEIGTDVEIRLEGPAKTLQRFAELRWVQPTDIDLFKVGVRLRGPIDYQALVAVIVRPQPLG